MRRLRILCAGLMLIGSALTVKGQTAEAPHVSEKQTADTQRVNWQVRAGVGGAYLAGGVSDIDGQLSYHIGGGPDIALSKNGVWRLQPMLQYSQKGFSFGGYYGSEQIMPADYDTKFRYLELPVQMAVRLHLGGDAFLTFRCGPYVAYGLHAKTTMTIADMDSRDTFGGHFSKPCSFNDCAYDMENRHVAYPKMRRWDAGLAGGAEFIFWRVIMGVDWSSGLVPLCKGGFVGNPVGNVLNSIFLGSDPRNFTLSFSLGYQF